MTNPPLLELKKKAKHASYRYFVLFMSNDNRLHCSTWAGH